MAIGSVQEPCLSESAPIDGWNSELAVSENEFKGEVVLVVYRVILDYRNKNRDRE
jgi:hypothetical protein